MAHRFTGKGSFVDRAQKMAIDAMELAERANAFRGSLQPVDEYDIIRSRGGDRPARPLGMVEPPPSTPRAAKSRR